MMKRTLWLVLTMGAALLIGFEIGRSLPRDRSLDDERLVLGLLDQVRLIREIQEGRGEALAQRRIGELEDYVFEVEERALDQRWTPMAFAAVSEVLKSNAVEVKPFIGDVLRDYSGRPARSAAMYGNVVFVAPPGASFEVPPSWSAWRAHHGNNIHTPGGDLERVVSGSGEWDTEYAKIANAVIDPRHLIFHGGDEGWGRESVSFGDLQVRYYYGAIDLAGAPDRIRSALSKVRVAPISREGDWERLSVEFDASYHDYSGTGRVDAYVQGSGPARAAFVFMHTGGHEREIETILASFRVYGLVVSKLNPDGAVR